MKAKAFIRVARQRSSRAPLKISAGTKSNHSPLMSTTTGQPLPTAAFAVVFDIPDAMFARAEQVLAEIEIQAKDIEIPVEVTERKAT